MLHFTLAESGICGGGQDKRRPHAPDESPGTGRREKESRVYVATIEGTTGVRVQVGLPDNRLDDPRDQVPILREVRRYYRLNVQDVLGAVISPNAEVAVVLKRNADQVSNWILRRLLQCFGRAAWLVPTRATRGCRRLVAARRRLLRKHTVT